MKNLLYLFLFCSFYSNGQQTLNDFQTVILPLRFEFQKEDNEYRLNSSLKFELEKLGIKVLTTKSNNEINFSDRCQYLYIDVKEMSSMLNTKIKLQLNDCQGNVIYESVEAKTKEKNKEKAYKEVTKQILESIQSIDYRYNEKSNQVSSETIVQTTQKPTSTFDWSQTLYAQKTENGFQLVDTTPKVILKMTQTSRPDTFMAEDKVNQTTGIVFKQGDHWIYELSIDSKTKAYQLNIKF
jgi:hypothetical protein